MSTFQIPDDDIKYFVKDVEQILGIAEGASYLMYNGRLVSRCELLLQGHTYHICPRVLGGKGGFGSMLRAIGAQIEKTTSREACRDLSGRRIRDVNNEKKLKDWVARQADREREQADREDRRRAKRKKYLEETPGKMDDPHFNAQYSQIMKKTEEAVQQGLAAERRKQKEGESTSLKRKADSCGGLDKYNRWAIADGVSLNDLDSDSGSEHGDEVKASTSSAAHSRSSSPSSSSCTTQGAAQESSTACATVTSTSQPTNSEDDGPPPCKAARLSVDRDHVSSTSATETIATKSQKGAVDAEAVFSAPVCTDPVDLDHTASIDDLVAMGMERLKADLMRRGMKCGGSLQERAQRLFSVRGLTPDQVPAKLLAKGKGQGKTSQK